MSKFREKVEAQTEEIIGRMLGDELLVNEGQKRSRQAKMESGPSDAQRAPVARDRMRSDNMPNEHAGAKSQGGKRDLQSGMPDPSQPGGEDQGIVRDERGQEQPGDKARAQQVSRVDKGSDPPGKRM